MPIFRTKKIVQEWIKSGEKTIELRKGKPLDGDSIIFLSGRGEKVKARIITKNEGKLEEVVNNDTYKKIVPTARNLEEALAFIKGIYPSAEGAFTTYEFQLIEN
jgi:ASC-1-like (ASCH) protein